MASPTADRVARSLLPRLVVRLSTIRWPGRVGAAVRRAAGRGATVHLFIAFDDAESAVAVLGLRDRLAGRRVRLLIHPVVARGIPDDPAVEDKRRYALLDARRLARRDGFAIVRAEPLRPEATAFLAEWTAAAPAVRRPAFAAAAMERLWGEDGPVEREPYAALWCEHCGDAPPADGARALRRSEFAMRRRRLYDTPVAVVHGQWFFAHERLAQIAHRLDELGWTVTA